MVNDDELRSGYYLDRSGDDAVCERVKLTMNVLTFCDRTTMDMLTKERK
jgi:hypothetical protein